MRSSIYSSRGGAEVQVEFIRKALVQAGHEVHFVTDANDPGEINDTSTTYHYLPDHGRLKSWRNFFAINRKIKAIRPDVIYQRVRFSYTGIGAYLGRRNGIPFIHHISADYACRKNSVPLNAHWLSSFMTEHLGRYGITHADVLFSQTRTQAKELKENFCLESVVIPNGHPAPAPPFEKNSPPTIAWVANIKAWKRPEIFIELASRLSDTDTRFVMAGNITNKTYGQKILSKIEGVNNIDYRGLLTQDEVNVLLSQAVIFINTSEPREGFPNTFIQAWMRRTPVISLSFDPDDVNTKENIGFLSNNIEQMEKDVRRLLNSPELLGEMGESASRYSRENYDIQVTASTILSEIERLLA